MRERSPLATSYAMHLFGQRIAVAPQTVAEARYGTLSTGWGRLAQRLSQLIARARVLPVDIDTIETVARLRNACRQIGHGLHQRNHGARNLVEQVGRSRERLRCQAVRGAQRASRSVSK